MEAAYTFKTTETSHTNYTVKTKEHDWHQYQNVYIYSFYQTTFSVISKQKVEIINFDRQIVNKNTK
jgi:hypothetical protein